MPTTAAGKVFTSLFGLAGTALTGTAIAMIGSRLVQAEMDIIELAQTRSREQLKRLHSRRPYAVKNGHGTRGSRALKKTKKIYSNRFVQRFPTG